MEVERFDTTIPANEVTLQTLSKAMRDAGRAVQQKPIVRPRPNEVGNDMEPYVIRALRARGFDAAAPRTKAGRGKSTGYPDIRLGMTGLPIYIEVKTYAAANHTTTQRSFYLSPAENPKVYENGHHLLVGFEMVEDGNAYIPAAFEMVDLYGLDCDMKSEFNSDNRRLYEPGRRLVHERL